MSFHHKPAYQRWLVAILIWPVEAAGLFLLIGILKILPRRAASALMSLLLRTVGPRTRWQNRSLEHLSFALPHLTDAQKQTALTDMWDNLGRNIGEYFHIKKLLNNSDLTISGLEHIDKSKGGFLVSGHFGNWELLPLLLHLPGQSGGLIYRPMNNPIANQVFKARIAANKISIFEKGREGAVGMLKVIKNGGLMIMLTDQTLREGDKVPFFGQDVPTATSHIKLAAKTSLPIYMVRCQRVSGAQHLMKIHPPIYIDKNADAEALAAHAEHMNQIFEDWIENAPGQWLWPHRRWGKSLTQVSE